MLALRLRLAAQGGHAAMTRRRLALRPPSLLLVPLLLLLLLLLLPLLATLSLRRCSRRVCLMPHPVLPLAPAAAP